MRSVLHFPFFPRFGRTMTCCAAQLQVALGKAFRDVERVADFTSQARSVCLCVCLHLFMFVCVYVYICMCVSVEPVEDLLRLCLTSSLSCSLLIVRNSWITPTAYDSVAKVMLTKRQARLTYDPWNEAWHGKSDYFALFVNTCIHLLDKFPWKIQNTFCSNLANMLACFLISAKYAIGDLSRFVEESSLPGQEMGEVRPLLSSATFSSTYPSNFSSTSSSFGKSWDFPWPTSSLGLHTMHYASIPIEKLH